MSASLGTLQKVYRKTPAGRWGQASQRQTNGVFWKEVSVQRTPGIRSFSYSYMSSHRATEDTEYPLEKPKIFSVFSVAP